MIAFCSFSIDHSRGQEMQYYSFSIVCPILPALLWRNNRVLLPQNGHITKLSENWNSICIVIHFTFGNIFSYFSYRSLFQVPLHTVRTGMGPSASHFKSTEHNPDSVKSLHPEWKSYLCVLTSLPSSDILPHVFQRN